MTEEEFYDPFLEEEEAAQDQVDDPDLFLPNELELEILDYVVAGKVATLNGEGEIRAEFLRLLLLGLREDWPVTPFGVKIMAPRTRLTGMLNLQGARARDGGPLPAFQLYFMTLEKSIDLSDAHFTSLDFSKCQNLRVYADRIQIDGDLSLQSSHCSVASFSESKIGGTVKAKSMVIIQNDYNTLAFSFHRTRIGGDFLLDETHCRHGGLRLSGVDVAGNMSANEMRIWHGGYAAFLMDDARIGGQLSVEDSRIFGCVHADNIVVAASAYFRNSFIIGPPQKSLVLKRAKIGHSLFLNEAVFRGTVEAVEMTVDGQVICNHSRFDAPAGTALLLSGTVARQLFMFGARVRGAVSALAGKFTFVGLSGATLEAASGDMALNLSSAQIEQSVVLAGGYGDGDDLLPPAEITGCFSLYNARIGNALNLVGASFTAHKEGLACLHMPRIRIEGALESRNLKGPCNGMFVLEGAEIDTLDDDPETGWPKAGLLDVDGLVYRAIKTGDGGGLGTEMADKRIAWLKRQYKEGQPDLGEFRPQPFEQLAMILRGLGYDYAATRVAIEKRELQRKYADRGIARLLHTGLKITSDYGYSPARALAWFASWVGLGALATKWGLQRGIFEKSNLDVSDVSHLEPISYAFDLSTPIIDFGQASSYRIMPMCHEVLGMELCGVLELLEVGYSTIGFILFSILVLTFSGVLRQEA